MEYDLDIHYHSVAETMLEKGLDHNDMTLTLSHFCSRELLHENEMAERPHFLLMHHASHTKSESDACFKPKANNEKTRH